MKWDRSQPWRRFKGDDRDLHGIPKIETVELNYRFMDIQSQSVRFTDWLWKTMDRFPIRSVEILRTRIVLSVYLMNPNDHHVSDGEIRSYIRERIPASFYEVFPYVEYETEHVWEELEGVYARTKAEVNDAIRLPTEDT